MMTPTNQLGTHSLFSGRRRAILCCCAVVFSCSFLAFHSVAQAEPDAAADEAPELATKVDFEKASKGLSSEDFATREASYQALKIWAEENQKNSAEKLYKFWKKQINPEALARAESLMKDAFSHRFSKQEYGFVGIGLGDAVMFNPKTDKRGVRVSSVSPMLAGDQAGLQSGDTITEIDGITFDALEKAYLANISDYEYLSSTDCFIYYILMKAPKTMVTMKVFTGNKVSVKTIKLGVRPEASPPVPEHLVAVRQILYHNWLDEQGE